ncbi:MAG: hypothetical protein ACTSWQ_06870 [Candidatus Thorarchaeota archaeon]
MKLLRHYYRSAILGWFQPSSFHWAKIVTQEGWWKWIPADKGIQGRLVRKPPLHIYQTLLRFKSDKPPRGRNTEGYLLGGPLLFETDLIEKKQPFTLWRLIDSLGLIQELIETMNDYVGCSVKRIMFSGFRGVHITFSLAERLEKPIRLALESRFPKILKDFILERRNLAHAIGYWCKGWDWNVSTDIWRVGRVPWSIHGSSSLIAIPLKRPLTSRSIRDQLIHSSPFSSEKRLRVRIKRHISVFTFIDGETYGPFRKDWVTKLPIAVALHLVWQDLAKPGESGPNNVNAWFGKEWQILMRRDVHSKPMVNVPVGGAST